MLEAVQAFTSDFIAQAFGIPIAHENDDYTPPGGVAFVELRTFTNALSPDLSAGLFETSGFFQFSLNFPSGTGGIAARSQAETIFAAYPLGRRVSYGSRSFRVTSTELFDAAPQDGWFKVVGRIFYELEK